MWKVTIDTAKCEGEGYCVDACPVMILAVSEVDGKKKATLSGSEEECLGCMACPNVCPTDALKILEA